MGLAKVAEKPLSRRKYQRVQAKYLRGRMLLEFVQRSLGWMAQGGWLAIVCLVLTFYAVFTIVKSHNLRTIRSDSFFGENDQDNDGT